MTQPMDFWRKVSLLAVGGGLAFWAANLLISLTPIAAEYRAALSIPYWPMQVAALLGGVMVAFCVSVVLLRFADRLPTSSPLWNALWISLIAFVVFTALNELPGRLFATATHAWRWSLIGAGINVIRFLAVGLVIGYWVDRVGGAA